VQPWPFSFLHTPAPSHALPLVHGTAAVASACPELTNAHVPRLPATLHALHVSVQSLVQHTPSTHLPDRHSFAPVHVCPAIFLHPPVPSHALSVTHAPTGVLSLRPAVTFPHVPVAHVLHAAVHASLQHVPSMQNPLAQSVAAAQVWPIAARHAPAPSQVAAGPTQVPSVAYCGTFQQVP
jgi:hypothetical protein